MLGNSVRKSGEFGTEIRYGNSVRNSVRKSGNFGTKFGTEIRSIGARHSYKPSPLCVASRLASSPAPLDVRQLKSKLRCTGRGIAFLLSAFAFNIPRSILYSTVASFPVWRHASAVHNPMHAMHSTGPVSSHVRGTRAINRTLTCREARGQHACIALRQIRVFQSVRLAALSVRCSATQLDVTGSQGNKGF